MNNGIVFSLNKRKNIDRQYHILKYNHLKMSVRRMKKQLYQNKIYVKKSRISGFGVFAGKKMRKGEKIEECYMIISRGGDKKLEDFYFDAKGKSALFTGYGSIYNHSDDENADYVLNMKTRLATVTANRTIQKDEEILISYGDEWFSSRGWKSKNYKKKLKS
jgi:uncharacterized protein